VHGGFLTRKILELRFARAGKEVREGLQGLRFGRERRHRSQSQRARQKNSGHECRSLDFQVPSSPRLPTTKVRNPDDTPLGAEFRRSGQSREIRMLSWLYFPSNGQSVRTGYPFPPRTTATSGRFAMTIDIGCCAYERPDLRRA
jgi:hypothetical protein